MPYLFTHEDKAERERLAAIEAGLAPFGPERAARGGRNEWHFLKTKPLGD